MSSTFLEGTWTLWDGLFLKPRLKVAKVQVFQAGDALHGLRLRLLRRSPAAEVFVAWCWTLWTWRSVPNIGGLLEK